MYEFWSTVYGPPSIMSLGNMPGFSHDFSTYSILTRTFFVYLIFLQTVYTYSDDVHIVLFKGRFSNCRKINEHKINVFFLVENDRNFTPQKYKCLLFSRQRHKFQMAEITSYAVCKFM